MEDTALAQYPRPAARAPRLAIVESSISAPRDDSWIDLLATVCLSASTNKTTRAGSAGTDAGSARGEPATAISGHGQILRSHPKAERLELQPEPFLVDAHEHESQGL
jgi:hypothetical protein